MFQCLCLQYSRTTWILSVFYEEYIDPNNEPHVCLHGIQIQSLQTSLFQSSPSDKQDCLCFPVDLWCLRLEMWPSRGRNFHGSTNRLDLCWRSQTEMNGWDQLVESQFWKVFEFLLMWAMHDLKLARYAGTCLEFSFWNLCNFFFLRPINLPKKDSENKNYIRAFLV